MPEFQVFVRKVYCKLIFIVFFGFTLNPLSVSFPFELMPFCQGIISFRILNLIIFFLFSHVLCVDTCLLYTSDAADEEDSVDLGGRRIIKKKKKKSYRQEDADNTKHVTLDDTRAHGQ
eukprot:TRINITY_DN728_c0_g3_i2.p2 TRINITY_DN728_c0_g3~~TRINITY_DN728_c0_g3_i2.p2  ORF type:complete len:118 (-),score=15.80 TRINITY_DN728_c0_g3_i2:7-360(-)